MKVLHAIQQLHRGGAETVVLSLHDAFNSSADSASRVAAAPGNWSAAFGTGTIPLPVIGRNPGRLVQAARVIRHAAEHHSVDVIHAHNPLMAMATGMATLGGRRVPALTTIHGVPQGSYASAATLLRAAKLPVVGCGPAVTRLLQEHGCPTVDTVVNGVAPQPASTLTAPQLLSQWGRPDTDLLITLIGRLNPQKRQDRAIHALRHLPNATLALLGAGPDLDHLHELATAQGVSDRVVFAGVRPDARAVMTAADIVLMTSDWEGLPLTLLEAMMSGTPIIATDVPGISELITHELDGILVDPHTASDLPEAITTLRDDPPMATRLAANALHTGQRYTTENMVKAYREWYERLAR